MKNLTLKRVFFFALLLSCFWGYSQDLQDKEMKNHPQDMSVPPPPVNAFPAQFPGGNRMLVTKITKLLQQESFGGTAKKKYSTTINFKIDDDGSVINISAYGNNPNFNKAVEKVTGEATKKIKWIAGKNSEGETVIDIVRIPFSYWIKSIVK